MAETGTAKSNGHPKEIPLADAAHLLGMGYLATRNALFSGRLQGRKSNGRWLVTRTSLLALQKERAR